jgi:hypothetical protein
MNIFRDSRVRLGMSRQEAVRENAHVSVQHRIDRHCDQVTGEMHLLALPRQLTNSADALTHELPVGHANGAFLLHGLGAFIHREDDKDQPGD